ncbi:hypothetical protein R1flu_008428 [Riccia fluitans]|uniref:Uncharacterized protein n=1 Tax=Riccia fluitans TaxID=41844 RepID=A0ABD1YBW2_9MARC
MEISITFASTGEALPALAKVRPHWRIIYGNLASDGERSPAVAKWRSFFSAGEVIANAGDFVADAGEVIANVGEPSPVVTKLGQCWRFFRRCW